MSLRHYLYIAQFAIKENKFLIHILFSVNSVELHAIDFLSVVINFL